MSINLKLPGLSEAIGTLRAIPDQLPRTTILKLSQVAYDEAQRGAQRHTKTGALVQSLFNRPIERGREVGHDVRRAPQALFINAGTKAHVIKPKDKKSLRWAASSKFFFAKVVNHPGYIGDAYIIKAATESVREFRRIVDDALKEIP